MGIPSQKISVYQVVGQDCLTGDDGHILYKAFIPELRAGREVELDFTGVEAIASPFFIASLGFLLRDFEPQSLRPLIAVSNLPVAAHPILSRVLQNCRRYYRKNSVYEPVV